MDREATTPARRHPPIAREGWIIIAVIVLGFTVLAGAAWWLLPGAGVGLAAIGVVVTLWAVWFFRDPERAFEAGDSGTIPVVCPADGAVSFAGPGRPPSELGLDEPGMLRISIFMDIFSVHVNRAPVAGRVERIAYKAGKFFNAALDKSSEHNERCGLILAMPDGRRVGVVQIAGLIARRIVCRVKEGEVLAAGQRFGMIRFGSRVDVYLPAGTEPLVRLKDKVHAGRTIVARLAPAGVGRPQLQEV